eukprot:gnl/Dysnectes_brevis/6708_a10614_180.p1 GENE.gnl/Dysnectes_brevis/6708_a10614_180~~gnl/Dysnectes_brevis/6708_a10614_180.p1  ORF type:complete len:716 (+),score=181.03 gnl/Dysnectes_brevis/6708_a10614_180:245-2149(+)
MINHPRTLQPCCNLLSTVLMRVLSPHEEEGDPPLDPDAAFPHVLDYTDFLQSSHILSLLVDKLYEQDQLTASSSSQTEMSIRYSKSISISIWRLFDAVALSGSDIISQPSMLSALPDQLQLATTLKHALSCAQEEQDALRLCQRAKSLSHDLLTPEDSTRQYDIDIISIWIDMAIAVMAACRAFDLPSEASGAARSVYPLALHALSSGHPHPAINLLMLAHRLPKYLSPPGAGLIPLLLAAARRAGEGGDSGDSGHPPGVSAILHLIRTILPTLTEPADSGMLLPCLLTSADEDAVDAADVIIRMCLIWPNSIVSASKAWLGALSDIDFDIASRRLIAAFSAFKQSGPTPGMLPLPIGVNGQQTIALTVKTQQLLASGRRPRVPTRICSARVAASIGVLLSLPPRHAKARLGRLQKAVCSPGGRVEKGMSPQDIWALSAALGVALAAERAQNGRHVARRVSINPSLECPFLPEELAPLLAYEMASRITHVLVTRQEVPYVMPATIDRPTPIVIPQSPHQSPSHGLARSGPISPSRGTSDPPVDHRTVQLPSDMLPDVQVSLPEMLLSMAQIINHGPGSTPPHAPQSLARSVRAASQTHKEVRTRLATTPLHSPTRAELLTATAVLGRLETSLPA